MVLILPLIYLEAGIFKRGAIPFGDKGVVLNLKEFGNNSIWGRPQLLLDQWLEIADNIGVVNPNRENTGKRFTF